MTYPIKRAHCPRCLRPARGCICQWITPTANQVELIILQHPLEVGNAKNTARLLHLSLHNSQLHTGEHFDDHFLAELLRAEAKTNVLLYPAIAEEKSLGMASPAAWPQLTRISPAHMRLIVVDGTWRKSRKILYMNPRLQRLPRLSLTNCPASAYHIRKAHTEDQLSTLEASCYALQQLEVNSVDYSPLLNAFGGFVMQQLALTQPPA